MSDNIPTDVIPGPLPKHHQQWFGLIKQAVEDDRIALMSCIEEATGENVSVICLINPADDGSDDICFVPIAQMAKTANPYDAYRPPEPSEESVH